MKADQTRVGFESQDHWIEKGIPTYCPAIANSEGVSGGGQHPRGATELSWVITSTSRRASCALVGCARGEVLATFVPAHRHATRNDKKAQRLRAVRRQFSSAQLTLSVPVPSLMRRLLVQYIGNHSGVPIGPVVMPDAPRSSWRAITSRYFSQSAPRLPHAVQVKRPSIF